jgi:hypothetical protein
MSEDNSKIDTKIYKKLNRQYISGGFAGLDDIQLMEEYKRIGTNILYDDYTRRGCETRYYALKAQLKPQSEPEYKRQPKSFNEGVFIKDYKK